MDYAAQIQRGVDYIEANLDFEIELVRVSKVAGISHWHFQRIFKAITGETLKTYVRSRRLAKSLDTLLSTDIGILQISVSAGFESQEAFTRAFKRSFGMTPNAYRKLGDRSLFLKKVAIDQDYLRHINTNVSLAPQLYTQPAMTLVGLTTRFYSVDSDKNNIGQTLPALWDALLKRLDEIGDRVGRSCYGVVQPAEEDSTHLQYHAVAEVAADARVPEGMVRLQFPAGTYAKFAHRGLATTIDHTVNYAYSTWLPRSGKRHTYAADLEVYGPEYHPTSPDSVMHYAIPVAD